MAHEIKTSNVTSKQKDKKGIKKREKLNATSEGRLIGIKKIET